MTSEFTDLGKIFDCNLYVFKIRNGYLLILCPNNHVVFKFVEVIFS